MSVPIPRPPRIKSAAVPRPPRLSSGGLYAGKATSARPAPPSPARILRPRAASLAGNTTNLRALPKNPGVKMKRGARTLLRGQGVI